VYTRDCSCFWLTSLSYRCFLSPDRFYRKNEEERLTYGYQGFLKLESMVYSESTRKYQTVQEE
jgi:hypothetical protein